METSESQPHIIDVKATISSIDEKKLDEIITNKENNNPRHLEEGNSSSDEDDTVKQLSIDTDPQNDLQENNNSRHLEENNSSDEEDSEKQLSIDTDPQKDEQENNNPQNLEEGNSSDEEDTEKLLSDKDPQNDEQENNNHQNLEEENSSDEDDTEKQLSIDTDLQNDEQESNNPRHLEESSSSDEEDTEKQLLKTDPQNDEPENNNPRHLEEGSSSDEYDTEKQLSIDKDLQNDEQESKNPRHFEEENSSDEEDTEKQLRIDTDLQNDEQETNQSTTDLQKDTSMQPNTVMLQDAAMEQDTIMQQGVVMEQDTVMQQDVVMEPDTVMQQDTIMQHDSGMQLASEMQQAPDVQQDTNLQQNTYMQQEADTLQQHTKKDDEEEEKNQTENELPLKHQQQEPAIIEKKDTEVENDFKLIQTPILKLNGNHSLSLNDDDTCSSTTSSASSHNLVIDHPLADEQPPPVSAMIFQENNLPDDVHKITTPGSKSLKRKLSSCDNDSPQYKYIHIDSTTRSPDKNDLEHHHQQKIPLVSREQMAGSINVENPLRAPYFWEKSIEAAPQQQVPQDEPLQLTKPTHQYPIKFVEENMNRLIFSQQIQLNNQEPSKVSLKEKPPPSYESYSGYQSSKIAPEIIKEMSAPVKFVSPQTYGPYPVYTSNSLPSYSFVAEISSTGGLKQQFSTPDSNKQVAAIATAVKESTNPPIGSYDLYTTPTGKILPPPKLNFECFKCKVAVFESFTQLRDHHKACLLVDNEKKLALTTSVTPEPTPSTPLSIHGKESKAVVLANPPGPLETSSSVAATTTTTPTTAKKRFYLCSSCGTYHENWNLFLHIREIHNRHVCLYCIRLFPTAEKLSLHLEIKHDLEQNHFNSEEKLRSVSKGDGNSRFLMCCTCQHVFSEHERFSDHVCTEYIQPCSLCGQKGRHLSNCKANPEKRQKTKRKTKTIEALLPPATTATATSTSTKSNNKHPKLSTSTTTMTAAFSTPPGQVNNSKLNNNNNQMVLPTFPLTMHPLEFSKQNGYSETPGGSVGYYLGKKQSLDDFNYHSDDSTNMVIDETCSTNNFFNQMPAVNPFKALDERERQEAIQKTAEVKTTLPPDIVPEAIPEPKPLIVPKIKLCVPKEFQKAVYMEMSSTDSNEDEDQDQEASKDEGRGREEQPEFASTSVVGKNRTQDNSSSADEKDSGQEDGSELNSKLDRILKAIEKTQCEIRKTKEKMMRTPPAVVEQPEIENHSTEVAAAVEQPVPDEVLRVVEEPPVQGEVSSIESKQAEEEVSKMEGVHDSTREGVQDSTMEEVQDSTMEGGQDSTMDGVQDSTIEKDSTIEGAKNSTVDGFQDSIEEPEEPVAATSTSTDYTSELENSNHSPRVKMNESESWTTPERDIYSPTPPPTPNSAWPSPLYQPEDSPTIIQAVSERENIENMEKECEHAKDYSPEREKVNSSSELDVETIQNQEESTMDIEERSKQQQTPPNSSSSPLQVMDFSPINEIDNTKINETATTTEEQSEEPTPPEINDDEDEEIEVVKEHLPPADGIEVANEDVLITDLLLDRPIEKFEIIEFVRLCVKAVYTLCLYCNHARRIAVCGHSLVLHLLAQHRFAATVDSITAEELLPTTIVSKLKSFLPELEEHYFNMESYSTLPPRDDTTVSPVICNERIFECFQCRFSTRMHKDLYLHNRKMHLKTAILCFMCRANFFSFSEILCHICPGAPNKVTTFDIKFRCCLCDIDGIPSPFRLMVHLRKKHFACDICLEDCHVQAKLSSHVWKHKLHHLCYRCGIAYRNKMDITKHLFWKHGTESIICKRCLQKRWRHVYHFCVPPSSFTCDVCSLCFSKATYLKVHQREHTGDFRYPCTEDNCEEKFVSRKLLLKHSIIHAPPPEIKAEEEKVENEEGNKDQQEIDVKEESESAAPQEEKSVPPVEPADVVKEEEKNSDDKKGEQQTPEVGSTKRKKKKSRNKESLEDLNLIAPNLSESDSSGESDAERPKNDEKDSLVPNVMLSPPSEEEKDEDKLLEMGADKDAGKIMDIWENFKSFQASQQQGKKDEQDDDVKSFTDSDYPTPILHVASSDHDYCAMYKIRPRAVITVEDRSAVITEDSAEPAYVTSDTESRVQDLLKRKESSISPNKKKRKSTGSHSSSSGSSSDSSSRSSCSCKTNCSCSSSSSGSGSSSSSDDSDSSTSEGRRRIAKKKQERADRSRLKSECSLKVSISENVVDVDGGVDKKEPVAPVVVKEKLEPVFIETDLETAESETDEEFYDEHPQKLASEMLAEKRQQLQDQMRLSPSHNYDIMENSRPSTPSLPEEMVKEKKVKMKKKKRDRKSTCKSQSSSSLQQAVPPIKLNLSINKVEILSNEPVIRHHHQTAMQVPEVDLVPPYDLIASPGVAEPPVAQQPTSTPIMQNHHHTHTHTVKPVPFFHTRMSEGSSCSDADSSLKRSQRARRPNKFYGYTSDDENMPGTPLVIGTRTFKPQPPPQLTWRKEDLPAPSKSILLNKQPRTPKIPGGQKGQTKKRVHQKTNNSKTKKVHRLPPIPTLKIRAPKMPKPAEVAVVLPPPPPPPISTHQQSYSSSRDDSDETESSDDDLELPAGNTVPAVSVVPKWNPAPAAPVIIEPPPPPPPPQASMFNQKIPPALLPNPDFATIQYFKRNNIRYPIAPPAGARQPRDGESVYCYCRCPYDEVSEMIACDGENCLIEWFHFECVGIMVAPQGKWFCAECRPKYSNELYPQLS